MKKFLLILMIAASVVACKNKEVKTEETDAVMEEVSDNNTIEGEFIYIADGAVLKGSNFIYAIALDKKTQELADKVAPVKKDDMDMVPVKVKGTLSPNPLFEETGEGWEQMLTITEIVEVGTAPVEADVKIGKNE